MFSANSSCNQQIVCTPKFPVSPWLAAARSAALHFRPHEVCIHGLHYAKMRYTECIDLKNQTRGEVMCKWLAEFIHNSATIEEYPGKPRLNHDS